MVVWLDGGGETNLDWDFLERPYPAGPAKGQQTNFCRASRRQHDELVYAHWPEQANIELVFAAKKCRGLEIAKRMGLGQVKFAISSVTIFYYAPRARTINMQCHINKT